MGGEAIRALREENDSLRARVAELEAALAVPDPVAAHWDLSPSLARMFAALAARGSVSSEGLAVCCVGWTDGSRSSETVKAQISRLRERLAPHGYRITAIRGWGYRMEKPEPAATDACVTALRATGAVLRRAAR
jgi:DNA-binding response OmpR family regulator